MSNKDTQNKQSDQSSRKDTEAMYDEENIHSNYDVSSKTTNNGGEETKTDEEDPAESPSGKLSSSKRWIWIGIAALMLVAIVGVVAGVLTGGSKSDPVKSNIPGPPPSTAKQLGSDLDGEAPGDNFGRSVSLSSDGKRLAVGADYNGNRNGSGHVRVFEWLYNTWIQLGSNLDGGAAGDGFGLSVSLSSDGNRLAVGAQEKDRNTGHVRVFDWSENIWIQAGSDLDGEHSCDLFGASVALSSDGNRLAVGARGGAYLTFTGNVRVFEWSGSNWIQLGSNLDGEANSDQFGNSVSLSSDGNRLAVGAIFNNGNGIGAGHVRVFEWSGSTWIQLGSDLDGVGSFDAFGATVSLSSDGNRLAVGAPWNDRSNGHVRVFDWIGNNWVLLGSDLKSKSSRVKFGQSVSLSSDGNRLAVGADGEDWSSHVTVFDWSENTWIQLGSDLNGEADGYNGFGTSISLSPNGNRLAVGALHNDGNGDESGHVRVFELDDLSFEA